MATSITGQGIAAYKAPDDALSSESKNAVQNKVIDEELSDVKNAISQNEESIADTQSMIATVEATTTASKNYAVGDLLVYDGKLYKVTSAIATGATIIVGSNVTQTTVETQIASSVGAEKHYELIKSIPINEATREITFDVDSSGNGFQLESALVFGGRFAYTGGKWIQFFVYFNPAAKSLSHDDTGRQTSISIFANVGAGPGDIVMETRKNYDHLSLAMSQLTTNHGALSAYNGFSSTYGPLMAGGKINKVVVKSEVDIPSGCAFTLYGVRA